MRVVLDTNVLISACIKPDGLEAKVVELALTGAATLFVTAQTLAEYREVFARPKFARFPAGLLPRLEAAAVTVWPGRSVAAAADEDDNRFLECAEAAGAEFLVTGNLRHYPAPSWGSVQIVNARSFLQALGCII